jgi:DNA-binding beta-propeller fold protein YncE
MIRFFRLALTGAVALMVAVIPTTAFPLGLASLNHVAIPPIEGKTGSFDILVIDQNLHLLYLADRTTQGVDVFDVSTPTAKYLRTINTGPANGVAIAKDVNKVFAATNNSTVAVIDANPASQTRFAVIASLDTGGKKRADEMDYDPADKKLYVANSDDGIVTVIDAVQNRIVKKFDNLGEGLEQPRYNPADGMMYMTSSDQNAIFQFDPKTDTLVKKVDVGVSCNPNGLAINPSTDQALLGCSNKKTPMTAVWDFKAGKVAETFTQAGAGDVTLYVPEAGLFFFAASNFPPGAVLAIFSASPVRWLANVQTAVGSHTVAYDVTHLIVYTVDQRQGHAGLLSFPLAEALK